MRVTVRMRILRSTQLSTTATATISRIRNGT
jgi:hypothetical protein